MCACMHTVCLSVCLSVCLYVCMYVCMYAYMQPLPKAFFTKSVQLRHAQALPSSPKPPQKVSAKCPKEDAQEVITKS